MNTGVLKTFKYRLEIWPPGWPLALPTNIRMSGTNTVVFVRNVSDGGRKFYENDTRTSCRVDSELAIEANDVSLESRSRWVNDKTSFMTSPRDPVNLLLIKLPIITSLLYLFGNNKHDQFYSFWRRKKCQDCAWCCPWHIHPRQSLKLCQGSLAEGKGSVQLTYLHWLVQISCFYY